MIAQTLTQMEEMQDRMRHLVQEQSYEDALALGYALMEIAAALSNATAVPEENDRLRLEHLFKRHTEMVTQLEGDLQLQRTAARTRRKAIGAYARY
jgi:hypothetical protein